MTTASARIQLSAAGLAIATAAAFSPVIAKADSFALAPAPVASAAQVLTWGSDDLDPVLLAQLNDGPSAAVTAAASTSPRDLLEYLIQGVATGIQDVTRGVVVVVGTTAYVTIAFTGGVITTIGNVLPGPLGDVITNIGNATTNVANNIAKSLHVGPYSTVV